MNSQEEFNNQDSSAFDEFRAFEGGGGLIASDDSAGEVQLDNLVAGGDMAEFISKQGASTTSPIINDEFDFQDTKVSGNETVGPTSNEVTRISVPERSDDFGGFSAFNDSPIAAANQPSEAQINESDDFGVFSAFDSPAVVNTQTIEVRKERTTPDINIVNKDRQIELNNFGKISALDSIEPNKIDQTKDTGSRVEVVSACDREFTPPMEFSESEPASKVVQDITFNAPDDEGIQTTDLALNQNSSVLDVTHQHLPRGAHDIEDFSVFETATAEENESEKAMKVKVGAPARLDEKEELFSTDDVPDLVNLNLTTDDGLYLPRESEFVAVSAFDDAPDVAVQVSESNLVERKSTNNPLPKLVEPNDSSDVSAFGNTPDISLCADVPVGIGDTSSFSLINDAPVLTEQVVLSEVPTYNTEDVSTPGSLPTYQPHVDSSVFLNTQTMDGQTEDKIQPIHNNVSRSILEDFAESPLLLETEKVDKESKIDTATLEVTCEKNANSDSADAFEAKTKYNENDDCDGFLAFEMPSQSLSSELISSEKSSFNELQNDPKVNKFDSTESSKNQLKKMSDNSGQVLVSVDQYPDLSAKDSNQYSNDANQVSMSGVASETDRTSIAFDEHISVPVELAMDTDEDEFGEFEDVSSVSVDRVVSDVIAPSGGIGLEDIEASSTIRVDRIDTVQNDTIIDGVVIDEEDDFGDFSDFDQPCPIPMDQVISMQVEPNEDDFRDFEEVPLIHINQADAVENTNEPVQVQVDPDLSTNAVDDEDEFGDFGDFEKTPSLPLDSNTGATLQVLDVNSRSMFQTVFSRSFTSETDRNENQNLEFPFDVSLRSLIVSKFCMRISSCTRDSTS